MTPEFETELQAFTKQLIGFCIANEMRMDIFSHPDHVAIKARDGDDFERLIKQFEQDAGQISVDIVDNRRLAAVRLSKPYWLGSLGTIEWIEIMEPRPARLGNDTVGVDHIEFFFPEFTEIERELATQGISFISEQNLSHEWRTVVINEGKQEVKFSNGHLSQLAQNGIDTGAAVVLWPHVTPPAPTEG